MKRRRFFEALSTALLAVLIAAVLAAPAMAQGNSGKNKDKDKDDGGTVEPILPQIEYNLRYFDPPAGVSLDGSVLNDMNNAGVCVGFYTTPEGERHAWLFDPAGESNIAIDLNSIGITMPADGWVISSAVGINDFGAIVGYVSSVVDASIRRGFLVDMRAEYPVLEFLPDDDPTWVNTYARKINENGDILGSFQRTDGTWSAYIFNPGIYDPMSADIEPEIIDIDLYNAHAAVLNNPIADRGAQVLAYTPDSFAYVYTRGSGGIFPYEEPTLGRPSLNDAGTICGGMHVEVAARGNKTETKQLMFRDDGVLEIFYDSEDRMQVQGINSYGTITTVGWGYELTGDFLYNDDWGFVDIHSLVTGTDEDMYEWTVSRNIARKINDNGPLGFGQLAGPKTFSDSSRGFFILTPVELP